MECKNCKAKIAPHWLLSTFVFLVGWIFFLTATFWVLSHVGFAFGLAVLALWFAFEIFYGVLAPLRVVSDGPVVERTEVRSKVHADKERQLGACEKHDP